MPSGRLVGRPSGRLVVPRAGGAWIWDEEEKEEEEVLRRTEGMTRAVRCPPSTDGSMGTGKIRTEAEASVEIFPAFGCGARIRPCPPSTNGSMGGGGERGGGVGARCAEGTAGISVAP